MTTDSDCIFGTPKTVIRASKARDYLTTIECAMSANLPLTDFDPDTVWHVRQWWEAYANRRFDSAEDSRRQALRQAEAYMMEQDQ